MSAYQDFFDDSVVKIEKALSERRQLMEYTMWKSMPEYDIKKNRIEYSLN